MAQQQIDIDGDGGSQFPKRLFKTVAVVGGAVVAVVGAGESFSYFVVIPRQ